MLNWIRHFVNSFNYWGVAILMAVENVVLPIPSELIMPFAGFKTARDQMTLIGVILAGTIGSVLGALPLYYAGYALGEERLKKWVERHGKWMLLRGKDLDRATARFSGNSFVEVALGQLLPGVRGVISIPAGVARMNIGLFLLANFVGTIVWCAVLAVAGRLLGRNFTRIHKFLGPAGWVILGLLVVTLAVWLIRRRRRRSAIARG
ncbi:MAG: DedA family protein [Gemmatimonadota bacterium]|nr:DedA family protein [Gemmatimonadota bacterium]